MIVKPSVVGRAIFDILKCDIVSVSLTERDYSKLECAIIVLLILFGKESEFQSYHKSISEKTEKGFNLHINEEDFLNPRLQEISSYLLDREFYDESFYPIDSFDNRRLFERLFYLIQ